MFLDTPAAHSHLALKKQGNHNLDIHAIVVAILMISPLFVHV